MAESLKRVRRLSQVDEYKCEEIDAALQHFLLTVEFLEPQRLNLVVKYKHRNVYARDNSSSRSLQLFCRLDELHELNASTNSYFLSLSRSLSLSLASALVPFVSIISCRVPANCASISDSSDTACQRATFSNYD